MKMSTFAIGMTAGTLVGAAAAMAAESMMTPRVKRDIKHYANKSMRAIGQIADGVNMFMKD